MDRVFKPLMALLLASLLTGCWWDNDDDEVPPAAAASVPDSAGASNAAFIAYIAALGSDEMSEPLLIGTSFTAAADETTEPLATP